MERRLDRIRQHVMGLARAIIAQALSYRVLSQDVRREAWALGGRHLGQVLIGARLEAQSPALTFRRASLLKAVIRSEARRPSASTGRAGS